MRPVSNQPRRIYATTKTHKFNSLDDINVDNLKFRPIISQIGTYTYNAGKVIVEYLKPLCSNQYKISDTQEFASLIKDQPPINDDEEYVSYDVDSLFTNIPVAETIEYIIHQIYTEKKIPPICSKLVFQCLLIIECSFQFNHQLLKQVEGCTMGGPLSVTFAEIHVIRMENDIVIPLKPIFYRRFLDDIINRCKRNVPDELFFKLNNYHWNIKLTIDPTKFLDTQLVNLNGKMETKVYRKPTKLAVPWSSGISKRYKRNAINGDLHRSKRIATDFEKEIVQIKKKLLAANLPSRFINSLCNDFLNKKNNHENIDFIIPPGFFNVKSPVILTEIPYCDKNEVASKQFIKNFNKFTNDKYDIRIKWLTRKMKTLFKLKDPCIHPAC